MVKEKKKKTRRRLSPSCTSGDGGRHVALQVSRSEAEEQLFQLRGPGIQRLRRYNTSLHTERRGTTGSLSTFKNPPPKRSFWQRINSADSTVRWRLSSNGSCPEDHWLRPLEENPEPASPSLPFPGSDPLSEKVRFHGCSHLRPNRRSL